MHIIAAASNGVLPHELALAAAYVALASAVIGLLVYVSKGLRGGFRLTRKAGRAFDEILGDGTDRNPGWGKRIETLEQRSIEARDRDVEQAARLDTLERLVRRVDHEVRPNGGGSMADAVRRIEQATSAARPPGS